MIYGGPIIWEIGDAAKVMRWYRDFQATAPEEFCVFLGLQKVPSGDPFPREHWNKKVCVLMAVHNGRRGRWRARRAGDARRVAQTDHRLGRPDAISRRAIVVRRSLSDGPSVVLEGRLR